MRSPHSTVVTVERLRPAENSSGLAYLDAAGAVKLYHVAEEIPKTDRVRLPAPYCIDGANKKFQVKYRYVRVLEAEDEEDTAAPTTVHPCYPPG